MRARLLSVFSVAMWVWVGGAVVSGGGVVAAERVVAAPGVATVEADRATGVYGRGEVVTWRVRLPEGQEAPLGARYSVKSGGLKEMASGGLTFSGGFAEVKAKLEEANTLLLSVYLEGSGRAIQSGVVVDPNGIEPAAEEPSDFDAFWGGKLAEARGIPLNAQVTAEESGNAEVSYFKVTLDSIGGARVRGQLARPARGEKFPAVLVAQWAGVYGLQKGWVTQHAAGGFLAMNIQAHDIPIDREGEYYKGLYDRGGALHNYWKIGNESPETSYYVRMYVGVARAIEYLRGHPDWDGKTLIVMGGSQGGQQALVGAALCPEVVTACLAFQPAACDNMGPSVGRASGFPVWFNQVDGRDAEKVRSASRYFDPVYFARRIKAETLVGVGLKDELAPPSSIFAMVNQLKCRKEVVVLPLAGHYDEAGSHSGYNKRLWEHWIPRLREGRSALE